MSPCASRVSKILSAPPTLDGFSHLPVSYLHTLRAGGLLSEHRDPFDRMLAAQSLIENVPLISCDKAFGALGIVDP